MIKFNKPENLNGSELLEELNNAGVSITEPPLVDGNNDLWLEINEKDKTKAKEIVDAHNGTITPVVKELTLEDKLTSIGLSLDELKAALGL